METSHLLLCRATNHLSLVYCTAASGTNLKEVIPFGMLSSANELRPKREIVLGELGAQLFQGLVLLIEGVAPAWLSTNAHLTDHVAVRFPQLNDCLVGGETTPLKNIR